MREKIILLLSLLAIFLVGCGQVLHTLDRIEVSPGSKDFLVGGTQQFTATGYDQQGNTIQFTPTWSAEGTMGAVSSTGLFTATAEGSGRVKASSGNVKGYANVTVATGELSSITVTPSSETLYTGDTAQFTATGKNSEGGEIPIIPGWSVIPVGIGTIETGSQTVTFYSGFSGRGSVEADVGGIKGYAAVTVNTQTTTRDITPEACTYVSSASATSNYGATLSTYCGYDTGNGSKYISYLKFPLSSIPALATIESVSFKFYIEEMDPLTDIAINLKYITGSWSETGINYNNQPTSEEVFSTYTVNSTGQKEISDVNITNIVKLWHSGSLSNYGFLIEPSAVELEFFKFKGRNSLVSPPKLSITYLY
ncbi:MAG: DNRLRE domain-containing protein [Candidatus Saganbacteria bacterium]|nr:DNRLRE domain-containing protein [Candidatus Saganbacteria bacterium]